MAEERLPSDIQTALLTVLAYDREFGAMISEQVKPLHFDPSHRDLATLVLRYRRDYHEPPGDAHLRNLASGVRGISPRLLDLVEADAEVINARFIATRAEEFVRRQVLKVAVLEAAERYNGDSENMADDVQNILSRALRYRSSSIDAGVALSDPKRALMFLDGRGQDFVSLGIEQLDKLGIGPRAREVLLYIAAKATGKSWFCVHCGRHGLMQRQKVLHISLEMDVPLVIQRYYQNFFAVARRPDRVLRAVLEFDELKRLIGFSDKFEAPKLDFGNPQIRRILRDKQKEWGTRFNNLIVQAFPTRQLTYEGLVNYLDYLDAYQHFVPTELIIDYPDIMAVGQNADNFRLDLNTLYERLRGLGVERNMAVVAPTQGNRGALDARTVKSSMAAEGMGKVNTADMVLTYSQTRAERRRGLARLTVEHVRNEESGSVIVLAQNYSTGQYVTQSAYMQNVYWERLEELRKDGAGDDDS